jgi:hypothetical protein
MSDVSRLLRAPACSTAFIVSHASDDTHSQVATEPPALRVKALVDSRAPRNEVTKDRRRPPRILMDERHCAQVRVTEVAARDLIDSRVE